MKRNADQTVYAIAQAACLLLRSVVETTDFLSKVQLECAYRALVSEVFSIQGM